MELELTDDQELLRATTARFIAETCPLGTVRALLETERSLPDGYLTQAGDLGWFAMLIPEEMGGGSVSGEGLRDAAIVAEERGRALQPGAFISMNVVAEALARSGSATQQIDVLPRIVRGESIAASTVISSPEPRNSSSTIQVVRESGRFILAGELPLVQDAHLADWVFVTASDGTGMSQFLVPAARDGVRITPLRAHDLSQRFAAVRFDSVLVEENHVVGAPQQASQEAERQLRTALVLSVAETVGAMEALFEITRQYAVDRIAFGRPIGSFQAVKHQLADLSLSLEASKAVSVSATRAAQANQTDALEIARIAKAWVGDVGIDLAQGCFQVFGGIGYTWEHDLHLFLRRITMNNLLYGQPDHHREQICKAHGL
jgi:alkylation response protein AidB-like acyl-CoA dehydrogenase